MLVSEQHTSLLRGSDAKPAPAKLARLQVNPSLEALAPFHLLIMVNAWTISCKLLREESGLLSSHKSCLAMQGARAPACQRPCRAHRRTVASAATVEAPATTSQVSTIYASLSLLGILQASEQDWGLNTSM